MHHFDSDIGGQRYAKTVSVHSRRCHALVQVQTEFGCIRRGLAVTSSNEVSVVSHPLLSC